MAGDLMLDLHAVKKILGNELFERFDWLNTLTTKSRRGRLRNRYDCYQEPTQLAQAILGILTVIAQLIQNKTEPDLCKRNKEQFCTRNEEQ